MTGVRLVSPCRFGRSGIELLEFWTRNRFSAILGFAWGDPALYGFALRLASFSQRVQSLDQTARGGGEPRERLKRRWIPADEKGVRRTTSLGQGWIREIRNVGGTKEGSAEIVARQGRVPG